jgi:hypothetical protein
MRAQQVVMAGGAIVIAVVFFFIGKLQCPADGNPIGFHVHGLANIDNTGSGSFSISNCMNATCTLTYDFDFSTATINAPKLTCPTASNCFHFNSSQSQPTNQMTVTIDYSGGTSTYPDYSEGTLQVAAQGRPKPKTP